MIRSEHNAWIHAIATLLTIGFGVWLNIDRPDWLAIVLAITLVWVAEALNTAIEITCDIVSPGHDLRVKKAKDAAAGAVLLSAFGAFTIGLIIFGPRLVIFWK